MLIEQKKIRNKIGEEITVLERKISLQIKIENLGKERKRSGKKLRIKFIICI